MAILTFRSGECCIYDKYRNDILHRGVEKRLSNPLPDGYNPIGKTFNQILVETGATEYTTRLRWIKIDPSDLPKDEVIACNKRQTIFLIGTLSRHDRRSVLIKDDEGSEHLDSVDYYLLISDLKNIPTQE